MSIKLVEINTTMSKMENTLHGIDSILDIEEEKMSEAEDVTI